MHILDMILGADMANQYTDSNRVDKKVTKTISFDGDTTGKTVLPLDPPLVAIQVSSTPLELTPQNVKRITLRGKMSGELKTDIVEQPDLIIEGDRDLGTFAVRTKGEISVGIFSFFPENEAGIPEGVYFLRLDGGDGYFLEVASLEYETREIDQKLIPGYIPVIELENIMEVPASVAENLETATDHKAAGQLLMTEDEIAIATEAMRTDSPIVLKIKTRLPPDGDGVQTVVMNRVNNFLTWEFDVYQYAGWTHAGLVFMCLDDGFPKCVMQLFGCFTVTECRKYMLEQNA